MSQVRTSVSIDDVVMESAKTACKPENENRDFSNLCEEALKAYLEERGYLAPTKDAEARNELAAILKATSEFPEFRNDVRKLARKAKRMQAEAAAT